MDEGQNKTSAVVGTERTSTTGEFRPYNPDPTHAIAMLIGESISADVEAWDLMPFHTNSIRTLHVTRDGRDFTVLVMAGRRDEP